MRITVSKNYGLNPPLTLCPICAESISIALLGQINKQDDEAPRQICAESPCEKCLQKFEEYKKQGFVVFRISDDYEKQQERSPWVFFLGLLVLKNGVIKEIFPNVDDSAGAIFLSNSIFLKVFKNVISE
jgi:hypothetical protein